MGGGRRFPLVCVHHSVLINALTPSSVMQQEVTYESECFSSSPELQPSTPLLLDGQRSHKSYLHIIPFVVVALRVKTSPLNVLIMIDVFHCNLVSRITMATLEARPQGQWASVRSSGMLVSPTPQNEVQTQCSIQGALCCGPYFLSSQILHET